MCVFRTDLCPFNICQRDCAQNIHIESRCSYEFFGNSTGAVTFCCPCTLVSRLWVSQQLAEGPYGLRQLNYVGWVSVLQRKRRGKVNLLGEFVRFQYNGLRVFLRFLIGIFFDLIFVVSATSIIVVKKSVRSLVAISRFSHLTSFEGMILI